MAVSQPIRPNPSASNQAINRCSFDVFTDHSFRWFFDGFFTFLLMDSAVSAVLRKELGVRGAARKFSVNRHSLTTRLLLIERSERDDLDSGRNHRLSDVNPLW